MSYGNKFVIIHIYTPALHTTIPITTRLSAMSSIKEPIIEAYPRLFRTSKARNLGRNGRAKSSNMLGGGDMGFT
jgi:hypothetical protein